MIFQKNPSEVGPEVVQPGPLLVQPQIKSCPGWTRSGDISGGSGSGGGLVVEVGPLLVQPQMVFFKKSSKIGLKTKI